jgi:hypothetical protein
VSPQRRNKLCWEDRPRRSEGFAPAHLPWLSRDLCTTRIEDATIKSLNKQTCRTRIASPPAAIQSITSVSGTSSRLDAASTEGFTQSNRNRNPRVLVCSDTHHHNHAFTHQCSHRKKHTSWVPMSINSTAVAHTTTDRYDALRVGRLF